MDGSRSWPTYLPTRVHLGRFPLADVCDRTVLCESGQDSGTDRTWKNTQPFAEMITMALVSLDAHFANPVPVANLAHKPCKGTKPPAKLAGSLRYAVPGTNFAEYNLNHASTYGDMVVCSQQCAIA